MYNKPVIVFEGIEGSGKTFHINLVSNYLKKKRIDHRDKLERVLKKNKIEFRRGNAGGGNQLKQPYLKKFIKKVNPSKFKEVDHIHFFGYYIGNYPSLKKDKIITICNILNKIKYEK